MKTVRVYTLKVEHQSIPEVDRHIDMQLFNTSDSYPRVEKLNESISELKVNHERIEVQRFCSKVLPNHLNPSPFEHEVKEEYIAIPKDLERLLMIKYEQRIAEQAEMTMRATKRADDKGRELDLLNSYIDYWWKKPWYRRVIAAIKG